MDSLAALVYIQYSFKKGINFMQADSANHRKTPGPLRHKFMGSRLPIKFDEADCKNIKKHHVTESKVEISASQP
jgi:hypothetical protein